MISVSKTVVRGKGHADDQKFLYINLHGFKDELEHDIVYQQIQDLLKSRKVRIKVF